jgi:hypothetical protein
MNSGQSFARKFDPVRALGMTSNAFDLRGTGLPIRLPIKSGEQDQCHTHDPQDRDPYCPHVHGASPRPFRVPDAELPELGSLIAKQIALLAGLAPFTRQSGKWHGKSLISGGRASVRAILFMGALVAFRHNSVPKAFRDRLVAQGKPRFIAIIATAPLQIRNILDSNVSRIA